MRKERENTTRMAMAWDPQARQEKTGKTKTVVETYSDKLKELEDIRKTVG